MMVIALTCALALVAALAFTLGLRLRQALDDVQYEREKRTDVTRRFKNLQHTYAVLCDMHFGNNVASKKVGEA